MKRTSAVALAIVSILFFLGLALFALWRGLDARSAGRAAALDRFQALSKRLVSAHGSAESFASETFRQQMGAEMSRPGAPLAILVTSQVTGEALYLMPARSHLAVQGPTERALLLSAHPSGSTQLFTLPLALVDGSQVVFHAVYPVLTWGNLSRILSDCLYLIAAFFLILLIGLIVQTIVSALGASRDGASSEPSVIPIEPFSPSQPAAFHRYDSPIVSPGALSAAPDEEEFPIPELDGISAAGGDLGAASRPGPALDLAFPSFDLPSPESLDADGGPSADRDSSEATVASPRGLYDPETGVGWESFYLERLGSEIARAASANQDLSLAVFQPVDAGRPLSLLASDIIARFAFRDLAFSWKGRGIALILPGTSIEKALAECQDFLDGGMAGARGGSSVRVGASSLAGRKVDAERLDEEAAGALERALNSDDSPIIGFKADPERYASYLSDRF